MNTSKRDYSATPFKRLVVMGESTVQGGAWLGQIEDRFADVLANLIDTCQKIPVEYHNHSKATGCVLEPSVITG